MKRLSELTGEQLIDVLYALCPLFPVIETIDVGEPAKGASSVACIAKAVKKLIPVVTSEENRSCVWKVLSVLDGVSPDEVKRYSAPRLARKIRKVFSEGELINFLSYAEE